MSITTISDYRSGFINLPVTNPTQEAELQAYIEKYEPEILENLLGYSTKKDFLAGLEDETIAEKWTDLLNGAEYYFNGSLKKFNGVKNILIGRIKFYFLRNIKTQTTPIGEVRTISETAENTNNNNKMIIVYNDSARLAMQCYLFLSANESTYPDFEFTESYFETINDFGI